MTRVGSPGTLGENYYEKSTRQDTYWINQNHSLVSTSYHIHHRSNIFVWCKSKIEPHSRAHISFGKTCQT